MAKEVIRVDNARHMVLTQVCRLSFPVLFTPKGFKDKPNEAKQYSAHLIFDSLDDLKLPWKGKKIQTPSLMEAIKYAKKDQWGEKSKWPHFPYPNILNGDDETSDSGEIRSGYAGKTYIKVKNSQAPKLYLANGEAPNESDLYGGCYVQAQILVRPYIAPHAGLTLRLLGIKKVKDASKFGVGVDLFEFDENNMEDLLNDEDDDDDFK